MKFTTLCLFFLSVTGSLIAQNAGSDTIPYTIAKYEIKKPIKVSALAEKLKLDEKILVKLNKFRSVNSTLVKGQRIKIPVYPKPVKEKIKKKPEKLESEKRQPNEKPGKVNKTKVKPEKVKEKPAEKTKPVELNSAPQKATPTLNTADYERDKIRLIMIDAILELNEAIMEGVKASLDSLDVKNDDAQNEKDVNVKNHKLQLARDRAVLMPYILHIQDSLSKEIIKLKAEKLEIVDRIDPPVITTDTVISGNDIIIYRTFTYSEGRPTERDVMKVITKVGDKPKSEVKIADAKPKKALEYLAADTVIVYDMPTQTKPISAAAEKPIEQPDNKTDNWEAARALQPVPDIKNDSTVSLKVRIPNSKDSFVIKPIIKQPISTTQKAATQAKASSLSNADSVKHIKAEFFFKRAQKAKLDKNYSSAEEYLNKAIELYPKYFDAWFALAETHDLMTAHQQALKEYETCRNIDSTQSRLYYSIGNSYMKLKQKTEAMHYYNIALSIQQDDIPSLLARASILADWKSYKASINDYDQILKLDRLYHYAYKARGQVKLLTKDFSSAMDDFTRFLIFEETDPSAFYYRGLAKIGNNELLDGCIDLATASELGYAAADKAIKKSCQ